MYIKNGNYIILLTSLNIEKGRKGFYILFNYDNIVYQNAVFSTEVLTEEEACKLLAEILDAIKKGDTYFEFKNTKLIRYGEVYYDLFRND